MSRPSEPSTAASETADRRTIGGVEVVTIPVSLFAELLECQRRIATGSDYSRAHPAMSFVDARSRLNGDPEVTVFLYQSFGRMTLKDAASACRERFGADRSPSRATIARYWRRMR